MKNIKKFFAILFVCAATATQAHTPAGVISAYRAFAQLSNHATPAEKQKNSRIWRLNIAST